VSFSSSGIAVLQITFLPLLGFSKPIIVSFRELQCDPVVIKQLGVRAILTELCPVDGG